MSDSSPKQQLPVKPLSVFQTYNFVFSYQYPKSHVILIIFLCLISGCVWALFFFFEAHVSISFNKGDDAIKRDLKRMIPIMCGIFVLTTFTYFIAESFANICVHNAIMTLRSKVYHALLRQKMQFYDHAEFSAGNLIQLLTTDIKNIEGASILAFNSFNFCLT